MGGMAGGIAPITTMTLKVVVQARPDYLVMEVLQAMLVLGEIQELQVT